MPYNICFYLDGVKINVGSHSVMLPAINTTHAHFLPILTPEHLSKQKATSNTKGASIRETDELVCEENEN